MKVLLINGSPRKEGNTAMALKEVEKTLQEEGIETINLHIGTQPVRGCIACRKCAETGRCVFHDDLYESVYHILQEGIDGIVIGSPTYYAGPNGSLCALLDRLFYSAGRLISFKPAAAVAICRRGGASAVFDRLNKYFTINHMPVVSANYWNSVHGRQPGEAVQDLEGMQTMRTIGRNMAWLVKSIDGKSHPDTEEKIYTSFVR